MEIITKYQSGDNIFFTSDTHFCHANIIKLCGRPFDNVEEMNEALIKNWNNTVGPNDIVYHLGDFCFGGSSAWHYVAGSLNGRIHLIVGNHDEKNLRQGYENIFEEITPQVRLFIEGYNVYLNHYPFMCYPGYKPYTIQLFGHIHSSHSKFDGLDAVIAKKSLQPSQYDVGVDWNNYAPISWREVIEKIKYQKENNVNMFGL
jgi:calcineurin-like phosphoesterase family protein